MFSWSGDIYIYIYILFWVRVMIIFDVNIQLVKAWTSIDWLSMIWKSDLSEKLKSNFFQLAVVSVLLYGCTTLTLTKHREKKLDRNCPRMLQAILNKSWNQHTTTHQLYIHLLPISKTIQIRQTRYAGEVRMNS